MRYIMRCQARLVLASGKSFDASACQEWIGMLPSRLLNQGSFITFLCGADLGALIDESKLP